MLLTPNLYSAIINYTSIKMEKIPLNPKNIYICIMQNLRSTQECMQHVYNLRIIAIEQLP